MKKGRTGLRKVLTFVELMVFIIIIVGVAAGITIPLYTGYVERKRVTEATSIMGAIITSQKVERSRAGNFYKASTIAEFKAKGIDITDTKFFTYETSPTPNGGFAVTATTIDASGAAREFATYIYDPNLNPPGRWTSDEEPILKDYLLLQT
jgi:Tfp pilus assembly protein PilE